MKTKAKATRRLLSIDWDFFTMTEGSALDREHPTLMDWGHSERWAGGLQDFLWIARAASLARNGLAQSAVTTSGEEQSFWARFRFARGARLFVMDSHKDAATLLSEPSFDEVWNFDAHHDCGYEKGSVRKIFREQVVDCSDWMLAFQMMHDADLHVRYPRWKVEAMTRDGIDDHGLPVDRKMDDGEPFVETFHDVVLARSGAWTPPWLDEAFEWFVKLCPLSKRIIVPPMRTRQWDPQLVESEIEKQIAAWGVSKTLTTMTKEQTNDRS